MQDKQNRLAHIPGEDLSSWTPADRTGAQPAVKSEKKTTATAQKTVVGVQAMKPITASTNAKADTSDRGAQLPRGTKNLKIAGAVAVGILAVIYVAGVVAFSLVTYPNTAIAGIDVSLMNASTAASKIDSAWSSYSLDVTGDGFEWSYKPESNKSFVNGEAAASEKISAQTPLAWPVKLVQNLSATDGATTDTTIDLSKDVDTSLLSSAFKKDEFETQLGEAVDKFNEGRSGTFSAAEAFDSDQGKFTLAKAKTVQKLSRDNVIKYAEMQLAALASSADLTKLGDDAYAPLNDSLTDNQVETACNAANDLLGVNVTLKLNGNDAGKLDSSTFKDWITFDDSLNPTLSDESLTNWANQLADNYNTVGSERTYTRADGKQVTVSGGDYGWSVDVDSLVSTIKDAVTNKKSGDVELSYKTKGDTYTNKGERDWGAYIDVDISEQYARYYDADGNILWETGVITGNPTEGNSTPTGIFYIKSNSGAATLVGLTDPSTGQPKYKTPVNYWMPFEGNAVGLHDASWQASYNFGNTEAYKSVGSHGCVNLPPDKARELHEMISVGLCVVVHN